MKKIKLILKIAVILVVLLILAALIVPNFIDMRRFTPAVVTIVKEQTGRDIRFDGPIKLSLFPWVKVSAENVALSNADGFAPDDMLAIGRVAASVKVLPLIKKQIQLGSVELDGFQFHYAADENGVTNLDDIFAKLEKSAAPAETPAESEAPAKAPAFDMANFSLSKVAVTNGLLSYDDRKAKQKITISPLELTTGSVALGKPVDIAFSTDVTGEEPAFNANAQLSTTVTALPEKITLDAIAGRASLLSDNSSISADLQANVIYDLAASLLNVDGLTLSSEIKLPEVDEKIMLSTSLVYDIAAGSFDVPALELGLSDIKATGSAKGSGLNGTPEITAKLATGELKLRSILTKLGMTSLLHDPNTYQNAALSLNLDLKQNTLTAPFELALDDVKISANITGDLSGAKPALDVPVTLNGMILDKYLPKTEASPAAAKPASTASSEPLKIEIPQVDLSGLPDVNFRFDAGFVEFSGIRVDKIALRSALKNSNFTLSTLTANLFGGTMAANASVTGKAASPLAGNAALKLTNIDIAKAIASVDPKMDAAGLPKRLNLTFNGSLKNNVITVSGTELDIDDLLAKLSATADLNGRPAITTDIAFNDVNLDKLMPASTAQAPAESTPAKPAEKAAPAELPLKMLMDMGIDFNGSLSVKSLTAQNISIQNIKSKLALREGAVLLTPVTADIYKGALNADITLTQEAERIRETMKINLANVSVDELFTAVGKGKRSILAGKLAASADLNSTGVAVDNILSTLSGKIAYSVTEGEIRGIAFDPKNPTNLRRGNTAINPVKGEGTIKDGVLNVSPVAATSQYLGAEIGGGITLKDMGLNLSGNVEAEGMKVPLTVGGTATSPKVSVDEKALAQALIQKYAKEQLGNILGGGKTESPSGNTEKPNPGDLLGDILKDALKK
jgi:AsmA protein